MFRVAAWRSAETTIVTQRLAYRLVTPDSDQHVEGKAYFQRAGSVALAARRRYESSYEALFLRKMANELVRPTTIMAVTPAAHGMRAVCGGSMVTSRPSRISLSAAR